MVERSHIPLRWVSNTRNPDHVTIFNVLCRTGETPEQALTAYHNWVNQFYIGKPKATDTVTVEELEDAGLVGLYAEADVVEDEE